MAAKIRSNRTRSYVDPGVQGALMRKVSLHWLTLVAVNCGVLGGWVWLFERADASADEALAISFSKCLPFFITSAALLPVFLYDTLKLTNRFAGPALRFRAALSDASRGMPVQPMQFRHDDFWQEMSDSFNALMKRTYDAERRARQAQAKLDEQAAELANDAVSDLSTERDDARRQPAGATVRSADEVLRLLDSIAN